MFIILLVLHVFVNTHLLWPLSLTCAEAPKPHVNLDNGGLGDSGNCCLSAKWKERLSCNGPPVVSVCKLLCTAAVWGIPLSCTSLCYFGWLLDLGGTSSFGGYHCFCQGESVLWLHTLAKISKVQVYLCCADSVYKFSSESPWLELFKDAFSTFVIIKSNRFATQNS